MADDLTTMAYEIADRASLELIECSFARIDHLTYVMAAEELAADDVMERAVSYLCQRGLAVRLNAGDDVHVILECEQ